jgi:hypothetical protein
MGTGSARSITLFHKFFKIIHENTVCKISKYERKKVKIKLTVGTIRLLFKSTFRQSAAATINCRQFRTHIFKGNNLLYPHKKMNIEFWGKNI